jgi:hypothetical protein
MSSLHSKVDVTEAIGNTLNWMAELIPDGPIEHLNEFIQHECDESCRWIKHDLTKKKLEHVRLLRTDGTRSKPGRQHYIHAYLCPDCGDLQDKAIIDACIAEEQKHEESEKI